MIGATAFKAFWDTSYTRMPGHWLLASMGKKVLRPGGLELTRWMIEELDIGAEDHVVELAPGLGRTAELILERKPRSYTGVEKSKTAAALAKLVVSGSGRKIRIGDAEDTGLSDGCATIACGEAFLTMQSPQVKAKILREIARILKPGGLYGMHELSLSTDSPDIVAKVQRELSESIRVNARPLSVKEWRDLLESSGFEVVKINLFPMALLEPGRLLRDEGWGGVTRMAAKLLLHPSALARVIQMRRNFRKHANVLQAFGAIVRKKS